MKSDILYILFVHNRFFVKPIGNEKKKWIPGGFRYNTMTINSIINRQNQLTQSKLSVRLITHLRNI